MRTKWHFRNEPTSDFSNIPAFTPKSAWKPPKGHRNLEVFLSQVESDLFKANERPLGYSNLSKEEWDATRSLADDRNIVKKRADNGSFVVIWDRNDYIKEAEIQLSNQKVHKSVEFKDKILTELVEKSNQISKSLKASGRISEKVFYILYIQALVFYIQIQKKHLVSVKCTFFPIFIKGFKVI